MQSGYESPYSRSSNRYSYSQAAKSGKNGHDVKRRSHSVAVAVIVSVLVTAVVCSLIWALLLSGNPKVMQPLGSTIQNDELDSTIVGYYTYDGQQYELTAAEVIGQSNDLQSSVNADGTYDSPSADQVLAAARNAVMRHLVDDKNVVVTQSEIDAYAVSTLGTSDVESLASIYGMGVTQTRDSLELAARLSKLRNQVAASSASGGSVAAPTAPADGQNEVGNADYAQYIIGLLGSHWNSVDGTWADTDNAYYPALLNQVFAPGSASYEAALAAYAVAYSTSAVSLDVWTSYVNSYLDEGAVSIATLRA